MGDRYVVYAYGEGDQQFIGACGRAGLVKEAQEDLAYFREMKGPGSGARIFGSVRHEEPDFVAHGTRDLGPIAGLTIRLQGSGLSREVSTANDGAFDFNGLLPGEYTVSLRSPERMLLEPRLYGVYSTPAPGSLTVRLRYRRGCMPISFVVREPGGIRGVLLDDRGVPFEGAYRTSDSGVHWRPILLPESVGRAVTLTKDGNLLLGTWEWLYRSSDRGETWERSGLNQPVSSLFTVPSTGVILAGTSDGLFRSTDNGKTWIERSVGLRSFTVTSFAASADGAIFAGTIAGDGWGEVYRSTDDGDHWRLLAPESLEGVVNAVTALPNGRVIAGTSQGIFRWAPGRRDWEQLFGRSARTRVSSLVVDSVGRAIAGTTNAGVFVSEDGGDTWVAANFGLPTRRIRALAVAAGGDIYAAAGPTDHQAYATGRDTNAGMRGVFRGRFTSSAR